MHATEIELRGTGFSLVKRLVKVINTAADEIKAAGDIAEDASIDDIAHASAEVDRIMKTALNMRRAIISSIVDLVEHEHLACVADFQDWSVDLSKEDEGIARLIYAPDYVSVKVTGEGMDILKELKANAEKVAQIQAEILSEYVARAEEEADIMDEAEKEALAVSFSNELDVVQYDGVMVSTLIIKRFLEVFSAPGFETFEDIVRCSVDFTSEDKGFVILKKEAEAAYKTRKHTELLANMDISGPAN